MAPASQAVVQMALQYFPHDTCAEFTVSTPRMGSHSEFFDDRARTWTVS